MDALSILPVKATRQPAVPQGSSGLAEVFQELLRDSALRLEAQTVPPPRMPIREAPGIRQDSADDLASRTELKRDDPPAEIGARGEAAEPARPREPDRLDGNDRRDEIEPASDTPTDVPAAPASGQAAGSEDLNDEPGNGAARQSRADSTRASTDDGAAKPRERADDGALGALRAFASETAARPTGTAAQAATRTTPQIQAATPGSTAAAAPINPTGAAVRVEVAPASVVAPPNAALGGGAAVAAMAGSAVQTESAQPGGSAQGSSPAGDGTASAGSATGGTAGGSGRPAQGPVPRTDPMRAPAGAATSTPPQGSAHQTGSAAATDIETAAVQPSDGERPRQSAAAPSDHGARSVPSAADPSRTTSSVVGTIAEGTVPNGQTTEASAQTAYGRSGRSDGGPDERGKIRDAIAPNTESRAPQSETDAPAGQLRTTPTHASTPAKDGQTQVAAARVSAADPSAAAAPGSTIEPTSRAIGSAGKRLAPGAAAQVGEPGGPPSANSSGPTLPGLTQSATRGAGTAPAQTPPSDQPVPIEQVAVHIRKAVKAGQDHIRIRLHPAELGQIDVKLQMSGDGAVKAVIAVDRSETLDLLQRDARGLERSLQDAGLKTDSGSLSFHLRGEGNGDMKGGTGGSGPAGSTQERAHETRSAADAPAPPPPARADRVLDITV